MLTILKQANPTVSNISCFSLVPSKPNDSEKIIKQIAPDYSSLCKATGQPWIATASGPKDDGRLPKWSNRIQGSLAWSSNAPPYCKNILSSKSTNDDDAINSCISAFSIIGATCDVRGGMAVTECGTWTEDVCDPGTGKCYGNAPFKPSTTITPKGLPTS